MTHLHRGPWVPAGARPSLRPPSSEGDELEANLGRQAPRDREAVFAVVDVITCCRTRHCERSEAIQNLSAEGLWIASSLALLAMTRFRKEPATHSVIVRHGVGRGTIAEDDD